MRSKIRISSNREKPIDFLAKVILIIEGKLPIPADFMCSDYRTPFKIFPLVATSEELETVAQEIEVFLNVNKRNKRFQDYWGAQKVLCSLQLDRKRKQEK